MSGKATPQTPRREAPPQEAPKREPVAKTYYATKGAKEWEVWRLDVAQDGSTTRTQVASNPSRLVIRERLLVLLQGVLP